MMDTNELIKIAEECANVEEYSSDGEDHTEYTFTSDALQQFAERVQPQWMPIESAPKDGTRVLLKYGANIFSGAGCDVVAGEYDIDSHAMKPRPYWSNDLESLRGKGLTRQRQPNFWMPIPPPPRG